MSTRSLRRAAERQASKLARKQAKREISVAGHHQLTSEAGPAPISSHNRTTGPQMSDGKAPSWVNHTPAQGAPLPVVRGPEKHGLTGNFVLLQSESQKLFEELCHALRTEHAPSTPTETLLVDRLAEHVWCSQRAQRFQNDAALKGEQSWFALMLRYQTMHDRAFHKCLAELRTMRRENRHHFQKQVQSQPIPAVQATQFESQNPEIAPSATPIEAPSPPKSPTASASARTSKISPAAAATSNGKDGHQLSKLSRPPAMTGRGTASPW